MKKIVSTVVVMVKRQATLLQITRTKKEIAKSQSLLELCILASDIKTNKERKEIEVPLVATAIPLMENIAALDLFINQAALSSTKHLAIEHYAKTKGIKRHEDFQRLVEKINRKKCGGKKAFKVLVELVMPLFEIQPGHKPTLSHLSKMANSTHLLPDRERNIALELISKELMKQLENEKELFFFLSQIVSPLTHNCIIAGFVTTKRIRSLESAGNIFKRIKIEHPSAKVAEEAIAIKTQHLFKFEKPEEILRFFAIAERLTAPKKRK